METTSNNKKKRGDDSNCSPELAAVGVSNKKPHLDNTAPTNLFCDELEDPLFFMVGFLESSERWKLAEACRSTCRLVEKYSQVALVKLAQEHKVDEGFFNRLRDDNTSSRILEHQQRKGGELPHRYLLEKAKCTYLYTLEMMHGVHGVSNGVDLSTGDGGSRLVMAGTLQLNQRPRFGDPNWPPISIYSWDVIENRLLQRVDIPAEWEEFSIKGIFLMANNRRIVTCTNRRILVSSAEDIGEFLHTYSQSTYIDAVAQVDAHTIVFLDYRSNQENSNLRLFDILTGSTQLLTELSTGYPCTIRAVCNSRWIVLDEDSKLRVLDMKNAYCEVCSLPTSYTSITDARGDRQNIFYCRDYFKLQVLRLSCDSGQLSRDLSIEIAANKPHYYNIGMSGTRLFFEKNHYAHLHRRDADGEDNDTNRPTVDVVAIRDGTVKRSLELPANHRCNLSLGVQSNGSELFVGLEPVSRSSAGLPGSTIAAYLAKEHY